MLRNNVKYAAWQNAVGELYASLHPVQLALERTHRGGRGSPTDLLGGIVLPFNLQLQQSADKSHPRQRINLLCQWLLCSPGLRFQAQWWGAAQHRHPLRLQHQDDHRLRWLCGLHDPPGDPVQWVPKGNAWELWACLRYLVSFSCEFSKLHGKVRVPAKLCQR